MNSMYKFFFLIAFAIHFYFSFFVGLNHSILDQHGFRQTQTALTTYYILENGFSLLHNQTPLFGPPWLVPLEYPVYQNTVAILVRVFNLNIEPAGRIVSILAFYVFIFCLIRILKTLYENKNVAYAAGSLMLVNPVYLFWSRTFMIETSALMFVSIYALIIIGQLKSSANSRIFIVLGILFGTMAALTKVTTFLVVLPIITLIVILAPHFLWHHPFSIKKIFFHLIVFIGIPFLIAVVWTKYADNIKLQNPFTSSLTSSVLNNWNFGTLEQKTSFTYIFNSIIKKSSWFFPAPVQIRGIFYDNQGAYINFLSVLNLLIIGIFLFVAFNSFYSANIKRILLFLSYFSGLIVFTNLYGVHNYYWTATTFFFVILIADVLVTSIKIKRVEVVFFLIMITLSLGLYKHLYFDDYQKINRSVPAICEKIKNQTKNDEWILYHTGDWSAEIPYYSQRRAIMLTGYPAIEKFNFFCNDIPSEKIKGIVVSNGNNINEVIAQNILNNFQWNYMMTDRYDSINYSLYIRN
jgi:4-amino-4-deoxy-L-arabinose transferase-like glycosyltransferase